MAEEKFVANHQPVIKIEFTMVDVEGKRTKRTIIESDGVRANIKTLPEV